MKVSLVRFKEEVALLGYPKVQAHEKDFDIEWDSGLFTITDKDGVVTCVPVSNVRFFRPCPVSKEPAPKGKAK